MFYKPLVALFILLNRKIMECSWRKTVIFMQTYRKIWSWDSPWFYFLRTNVGGLLHKQVDLDDPKSKYNGFFLLWNTLHSVGPVVFLVIIIRIAEIISEFWKSSSLDWNFRTEHLTSVFMLEGICFRTETTFPYHNVFKYLYLVLR